MTDPVNSFAEAQQNLSDALFRLWMQPLQLTKPRSRPAAN